MPRVGFELTTTAFQRAKTVHALDNTATVIGYINVNDTKLLLNAKVSAKYH
jgi:hypothetical protein